MKVSGTRILGDTGASMFPEWDKVRWPWIRLMMPLATVVSVKVRLRTRMVLSEQIVSVCFS